MKSTIIEPAVESYTLWARELNSHFRLLSDTAFGNCIEMPGPTEFISTLRRFPEIESWLMFLSSGRDPRMRRRLTRHTNKPDQELIELARVRFQFLPGSKSAFLKVKCHRRLSELIGLFELDDNRITLIDDYREVITKMFTRKLSHTERLRLREAEQLAARIERYTMKYAHPCNTPSLLADFLVMPGGKISLNHDYILSPVNYQKNG